MYPKEQRDGNGVGAAPARGRTASPRPAEKISTNQKLDSTFFDHNFVALT